MRRQAAPDKFGEAIVTFLYVFVHPPKLGGMSTAVPVSRDIKLAPESRIAVVAARFNAMIVDDLLAGCLSRLKDLGAAEDHVEVFRVPGALELPVAAKVAAKSRRFAAVICLGCVIRGDTPHFDFVAGECARGIQQVAVTEGLPIIFGVLTTNTEQQAKDRAGGSHGHAGKFAADAAAEMIAVLKEIGGGDM
jgi:6,7-dimethyl-8-ribityllumazine synthase